MPCKICAAGAEYVFSKVMLGKYDVKYYRCPSCLFLQTEEPYWLNEAYDNVITLLDLGLIYRNMHWAPVVQTLITRYYDSGKTFLDFGGGYGMLVRMMRDRGFDFYRQDKFCENLFANHFDIVDLPPNQTFEAVTAFEIFEHFPDPMASFSEIRSYSDNIIFSTELAPQHIDIATWGYLDPETGQHISMYSLRTLQRIAEKLKLQLSSNGVNLHMFSKRPVSAWEFRQLVRPRVSMVYNKVFSRKPSLLMKDYRTVKTLLQKS